MAARDGHADARDFAAAVGDAEFGGFVVPENIARAPVAIGRQAEGFDGAKGFAT